MRYDQEIFAMDGWVRIRGTDKEVRLETDTFGGARSIQVRDFDPEPKPAWWPPMPGEVFESIDNGSRYMVLVNGKAVGNISGSQFTLDEFGHGDGNGNPCWRLLVKHSDRT